jgi:hypothetical protein
MFFVIVWTLLFAVACVDLAEFDGFFYHQTCSSQHIPIVFVANSEEWIGILLLLLLLLLFLIL